MSDDESRRSQEQPIIIKKIKKGGHGHHGGAWKVAYADFVTAMMAFFIVMWIVAATQETKEQIVAYFKDPGAFNFVTGKRTLPVDLQLTPIPGARKGKDDGDGGGDKNIDQGITIDIKISKESTDSLFKDLKELAVRDSIESQKRIEKLGEELEEKFKKIAQEGNDEISKLLLAMDFEITGEGLKIELIEAEESTYFGVGSSVLQPAAVEILKRIARDIGKLPNFVELEGHTDPRGYKGNSNFSNWELSADRANAARRVLELQGLWDGQIARVSGYADQKLLVKDNPFDQKNRRVTVLVRNQTTTELLNQRLTR